MNGDYDQSSEFQLPQLPCNHMIIIWVLGNLFSLMTGYQTPYNQVIAICVLFCWFPQKVTGEANREDHKSLDVMECVRVDSQNRESTLRDNVAQIFCVKERGLKRPLPDSSQSLW